MLMTIIAALNRLDKIVLANNSQMIFLALFHNIVTPLQLEDIICKAKEDYAIFVH